MFKYNTYTLKKIQGIFDELEYKIRYEKGNFQSGYCIVENKKIAVINKFFDTESKINCLIDILGKIEVDVKKLTDKNGEYYQLIMQKYSEKQKNTLFDDQSE